MEYSSYSEHSYLTVVAGVNAYRPEEEDQLVSLPQAELNNLTWDQNLLNESAQLLGSRLKEKHMMKPGTMFYRYRVPESVFTVEDYSVCNKDALT